MQVSLGSALTTSSVSSPESQGLGRLLWVWRQKLCLYPRFSGIQDDVAGKLPSCWLANTPDPS